MPFTLQANGSTLRLALDGELTIAHAREFAEALKPALNPGIALAVDATRLMRLDAATLQLLLAAAQLADDTTLVGLSPAWSNAFSRYAAPDPFRTA